MAEPFIITNYTMYKFCELPSELANREFCFHQPPLDMSLKIVCMFLSIDLSISYICKDLQNRTVAHILHCFFWQNQASANQARILKPNMILLMVQTYSTWFIFDYSISISLLVMFLIMLFGITGNASIIFIILKNKLLRLQPTNLFLLNMAVSDILNLCTGPILYLFKRDILFVNYYLPKFCCIATPFLTGIHLKMSSLVFCTCTLIIF